MDQFGLCRPTNDRIFVGQLSIQIAAANFSLGVEINHNRRWGSTAAAAAATTATASKSTTSASAETSDKPTATAPRFVCISSKFAFSRDSKQRSSRSRSGSRSCGDFLRLFESQPTNAAFDNVDHFFGGFSTSSSNRIHYRRHAYYHFLDFHGCGFHAPARSRTSPSRHAAAAAATAAAATTTAAAAGATTTTATRGCGARRCGGFHARSADLDGRRSRCGRADRGTRAGSPRGFRFRR